jgi:hypothetical protein
MTDTVPVTGPVVWEVTDLRDRETTFVKVESSVVACKFRQQTDDNASGGNKSADKLVSVFITWGQRVVVSCTKFPHQSSANHFHNYCTVTSETGTQMPEPLPTLGPRKEFPWIVGEMAQKSSTACLPLYSPTEPSGICQPRTSIGRNSLALFHKQLFPPSFF